MNIDTLTIADALKIASLFGEPRTGNISTLATPAPVLVCTDKRGVVFGYTPDPERRPISLAGARMCLYWSSDVGGVFGLAENGPTEGCRISATAPTLTLEGVTAVFSIDQAAEAAWLAAPVQGRD